MIRPVSLLYCGCIAFIRAYKWIELQFLKLFMPIVMKRFKRLFESVGVILHCSEDREWTETDSDRVLSKCRRYTKLVHLKINDDKFFLKFANSWTLGLGETYIDKVWEFSVDEEDVMECIKRGLENNLSLYYFNPWNKFLEWLEISAFNLQTRQRAFQVGEEHYDVGNDLYEKMLDPWMQYTCGYWKDTNNLNESQINKMELIAKKLDLKPGMRVLDIGCGWGTLCKYFAEKYQVKCVGITVSKEGVLYGQKICQGLPVDIRLQDYRDIDEQFDRIVSVGMFEHVGFRNYREFFQVVRKCLIDDGIFLCQTIARNHSFPGRSDMFLHTYIFPNGSVPNPIDIAKATEDLFVIEDWHNFGQDYAKTLLGWRKNILKSWPNLEHQYSERFHRMWIFYLCLAQPLFSTRKLQLWQLVLSKDGLKREYRAVR